MTRIFLCEDDGAQRLLLAEQAADEPGLELVGSAGDAAEALGAIETTQPDVVVLDSFVPGLDGEHNTVERLRSAAPYAKVIVFSSLPVEAMREATAGADGYVEKSAPIERLWTQVRRLTRS
jgi:DNA-binding NarL/FixJ family response regulator